MFSVVVNAPILAEAELYGGKVVAALDRQHPRDLFDVLKLYEQGGLTTDILEAFMIYLAGTTGQRTKHSLVLIKTSVQFIQIVSSK